MVTVPKLWPGSTIVCLGGGPSLTQGDVDAVRGKARVIAINNAYQLAPWADCLYACDWGWWKAHQGVPSFTGLKYALTTHPKPERRYADVQVLRHTGIEGLELQPTGLRTGRNSGYQAINLAVHFGATRILLLGYDMQRGPGGQVHWHPAHTHTTLQPPLKTFVPAFATLVQPLRELGVTVINCTPRTALTCFPKQPLEQALTLAVAA